MESYAESFSVKDRDSLRDAFHLGLILRLKVGAPKVGPSPYKVSFQDIKRAWHSNRSRYEELVAKAGWTRGPLLFPDEVMNDYAQLHSRLPPSLSSMPPFSSGPEDETRLRSLAFRFWMGPEDEETERRSASTQSRGVRGKLRTDVLSLYAGKCQNCYRTISGPFHVHHIVPVSVGGSTTIDNLVPVHPECHEGAPTFKRTTT
jgi:hypothetical protein